MSSVRIFVPARLESSRVKEKMLQHISETETVIARSASIAQETGYPVAVVTDSRKIKDNLCEYDKCTLGLGDVEIVVDETPAESGSKRIVNALTKHFSSDIVVNFQGDIIEFDPKILVDMIEWFKLNRKYYNKPILTLTVSGEHQTWYRDYSNVKAIVTEPNDIRWFTREPLPYAQHHIGIYIAKREDFIEAFSLPISEDDESLEQIAALKKGYNFLAYQIQHDPDNPIVDINTKWDLDKIQLRNKGVTIHPTQHEQQLLDSMHYWNQQEVMQNEKVRQRKT